MPDKDGLEKNAAKLSNEWRILREGMRPHVKRWLKNPFNTHAWVNLWVEADRLSPYFMGHVHSVAYPVNWLAVSILSGLLIWRG